MCGLQIFDDLQQQIDDTINSFNYTSDSFLDNATQTALNDFTSASVDSINITGNRMLLTHTHMHAHTHTHTHARTHTHMHARTHYTHTHMHAHTHTHTNVYTIHTELNVSMFIDYRASVCIKSGFTFSLFL